VSSPTSSSRTSTGVGIALGVILLGLVAAFAIGLPKVADAEEQTVELSLPDALPGGYAAADDPAAFEGGQLADQAEAIAEQQKSNDDYGNQLLPEVLGTAAATRTYVADGTKAVYVQVFQSGGGAFAPNALPDPDAVGGTPLTEMKQVGDGACILDYGQAQPGQETRVPAFSQCQVTRDELTVQIGSAQVSAEDLVDAADGVLDDLEDA
jgi:hypothetical protein